MQNAAGAYPVEDWDHWANATSTTYPGSRWKRYESPEQAGWSQSMLADAQQFSARIGSAAVMVVFDGAVLAHWGQIERRYLCHSMRKSLLSALYGEHVAQGAIDLDETIGSIGIDDNPPLTEIEKHARVADLLKSRSGVYLPAAYEDQKAKKSRPARGSYQPGIHWHYNNWDFNVLATIFNQKTGGDLFEAFDRQLAAPLQMQDFEPRHGHYHFEAQNSIHPAYPLRMSARDLARFGLPYLREGKWRGRELVPAAWVHESTRSYSEVASGGYGYMWWIEGGQLGELGAYFAAGMGHRVFVIPRAQLVIIHRADTYLKKQVGDRDIRSLVERILGARTGPPVSSQPGLVEMPEPKRSNEAAALTKLRWLPWRVSTYKATSAPSSGNRATISKSSFRMVASTGIRVRPMNSASKTCLTEWSSMSIPQARRRACGSGDHTRCQVRVASRIEGSSSNGRM